MRNLLIIFTLIFCDLVNAQSKDLFDENRNLIDEAKNYYQKKEYVNVIKMLENILPQIDKSNETEVHKFLGFSYAMMNDKISARVHFKILLKLNPTFALKAQDAEPSIIEILNEVKKEIAHESALCSCFIPGIGQLLKGEEQKGKLLMLGASVSFVSTVLFWLETANKQQKYLSLGPDRIEYMDEYYNEYNKWFRISISSSSVFIGFYLFSIWDAYFTNTSIKVINDDINSSGFILKDDLIKIGYKFRF